MNPKYQIFLLSFLFLNNSCIKQFIPSVNEISELLVVQGLITDQLETYKIKLSKSLPLDEITSAKPAIGYNVVISDDQGNSYTLNESVPGTYISDSTKFKGIIGRFYTFHLGLAHSNSFSYESAPVEMKPVPPIDSIYYKKIVVKESTDDWFGVDACQIYLDTHDPENNCKYFRWDFNETWVLRLLFPVPNMTCWVSDKSHSIDVKSSAEIQKVKIVRHPVTYISNNSDRLKRKYSILVNQYSLNQEEYAFWEKVKTYTDKVGGFYDIIPASIPGNISAKYNSNVKVLGYFSVSAKSSKRIFIEDNFAGIIDRYNNCISDTLVGNYDPPELNITKWTLIDDSIPSPRVRVLTSIYGCYDCRVRGTSIKPVFWIDDK